MIWIIGITGISGLVLFLIGLRRRRVGTEPYCAACAYALTGIDAPSACPECGADLADPRAVRRGEPRRRPRLAWTGLALIVLALVTGGSVVASAVAGDRLNPYKPTWLLTWELNGAGTTTEAAALNELGARLADGALSRRQVGNVVEVILERQADLARPWNVSMGDFVVAAEAKGLVPSEDWRRFIEQSAMDRTIDVRPRVREGDPLPYRFMRRMRGPSLAGPLSGAMLHHAPLGLAGPEERIDAPPPGTRSSSAWGGDGTGESGGRIGVPHDLEVGPHEVDLVLWYGLKDPTTEQWIHRWRERVPVRVEVVPREETVATPIRAPGAREQLKRAISVEALRPPGSVSNRWTILVQRDGPLPMPIAFEAVLRLGKREWPLGTIATAALVEETEHAWMLADRLEGFPDDARTVTLVLRASEQAAERSPGVIEYWDGELVFEGVPIEGR